MLSSFIAWAHQVQDDSRLEILDARVTESPTSDNPSARLDIDTITSIARITCWKSGDYDSEVIDLESERTLYSSHGVFHSESSIAQQVSPFLEVLRRK